MKQMWKPGTRGPGILERKGDESSDLIINANKNLPLSTQRQRLPIYANRQHILFLLERYRTVIIVGETGTGKTTQIPQYLYEAGWAAGGRLVGCTQPRRVAAQTVAARVAEEMGTQLGHVCGYTIRFDDKSDAVQTRVKFLTDGILIREMMGDPLLTRYSVVMVDEAHERSVYTDVLIGLLKKVQKRRKDLRIIISSATLDAEAFKAFFLNGKPDGPPAEGTLGRVAAMSMEAGRIYPVDIHYLSEPASDYVSACLGTILAIHSSEPPGDVLVFVTGADECDGLVQALHDEPGRGFQNLSLSAMPLYAALAIERQLEAFAPTPSGTRKVVVATNIAETSVTIPGIVYVVDSMFVKTRSYNAQTGVDFLTVMPCSKAQSTQRAGRAGRVRPGKCYRLCMLPAFEALRLQTVPELQRADLSSIVLQLKALGIDDVLHFDFPSPPPAYTLARALELLYALGALDSDCRLTEPLGLRMAEFPLDPMLSKFLLSSGDQECSEEALTIAAMLSVPHVFVPDKQGGERSAKRHYAVRDGDHLTLLNVYRAFEANKLDPQWCQARSVNFKAIKKAVESRRQLCAYIRKLGVPLVSCGRDAAKVRRCVASAFFSNAAKLDKDGSYRTIRGGMRVLIHPFSVLHQQGAGWVLFHELIVSHKPQIFGVCTVEPTWLSELAPHFYTYKGESKGRDKDGRGMDSQGAGEGQAGLGTDLSSEHMGEGRAQKTPRLF